MGDKEGTENPKGTGKGGKPKAGGTPKGVTAVEKTTPLEAFLAEHSIDDKEALDAFKKSKISSLDDLLDAKTDDKVRGEIEKALQDSGSRFALPRFQKIQVESIENAKFFLKNPAAKGDSKALLDFLAEKDVLVDNNDRDKLLWILLEHNVTSLTGLHKLKADSATKAGNLKDAITKWNAGAGAKFAGITAAEVAREAGGHSAQFKRQQLHDSTGFGLFSLEHFLKGMRGWQGQNGQSSWHPAGHAARSLAEWMGAARECGRDVSPRHSPACCLLVARHLFLPFSGRGAVW